jgi:hypothetical protein
MSSVSRPPSLTTSILPKLILLWAPIVGGVVHQFLMFFFNIDGIYVFVNPPGVIYPFVSLEFSWWFVLLIGSTIMGVFAYSNRIGAVPARFVVPFYGYILFLLYLVKPI